MGPPEHAANWMWNYRDWLKDDKMKDVLFLPGSHDAGMSKVTGDMTFFASTFNTLTHTLGIYEQLLHGIRWFDIRPMIRNDGKWYCGHFNQCDKPIGWQGATGLPITDVLEQVHKFVANHKELVVLRFTHVLNADTGKDTSEGQQKSLLQLLYQDTSNLELNRSDQIEFLLEHEMTKYMGDGTGRMVITFRNEDGPGVASNLLSKDSLQYTETRFTKEDNGPGPVDFALSQGAMQAAFASKDNSLVTLAKTYQENESPFMPQKLYQEGDCRAVSMDLVQDDRLLTICLAASRAHYYKQHTDKLSSLPPVILVYGGQLIMDPIVLERVRRIAQDHGELPVINDNLGGDPWPGPKKSCVVYIPEYKNANDDLFCKGRFALEGQSLSFRDDVDMIFFVNHFLTRQAYRTAYLNLFRAIRNQEWWKTSPDVLGGDSPAADGARHLVIRYRSGDGQAVKERRLVEGKQVNFGVDIDWITYQGQPVPHPEAYDPFFGFLDDAGGKIYIDNNAMGKPGSWDPAPGATKTMKIRFRTERNGEWKEQEGKEREDFWVADPYRNVRPTPGGSEGWNRGQGPL